LLTSKGGEITKAKGIKADSLSISDFENMYFNSKPVQGEKLTTKTNYSKGSVTILKENITIDWNVYKNKKEQKVYEYKNIWVDTKPLYIDNLTKSISLYKAAPLNIVTFKQGNLKSSRLLTVLQVLIRLHHLIDLG